MGIRLSDFQCNSCNQISEILWKTEDPEGTVECPSCKSKDLTKHIGSPRIVGGVGGGLYNKTPSGFKDIIKQTMKTVPDAFKGHAPTCL